MPLAERLHELYLGLTDLLIRCRPEEMAIEEPFVARNVRSALAIGRAQAIAMLAAAIHGIPVATYPPAKVKQGVTDYGRGDKEQVQRMVCMQLGLAEKPWAQRRDRCPGGGALPSARAAAVPAPGQE